MMEAIMMNYKWRLLCRAEDKYTFAQSAQISGQTGLIGHLRADFGSNGLGFYTTWFDYREDLKTDEFKQELDLVINLLRLKGEVLHSRADMGRYCSYSPAQSRMDTDREDYHGFRVDSEKFSYLFRITPIRGDYNMYCYCYVKEWLDWHFMEAEKGIRFIDSNYKELFRIPDGGKIVLRYLGGDTETCTCRYIDDYHMETDRTIWHICQFAEHMEKNDISYEPAA